MEMQHNRFRLNRDEGKLLGVCAGISDHFGVEATLVRAGMILGAVCTFPVVVLAYFVVALVADNGGRRKARESRDSQDPRDEMRRDETRDRMRDIDARLQAIETELTSSGNRVAREIDSLR